MTEIKVSVDPVYVQIVADLSYLKAGVPSPDPQMENKRQQAIKVLTSVESQLKEIYCGPGMSIFVSFK